MCGEPFPYVLHFRGNADIDLTDRKTAVYSSYVDLPQDIADSVCIVQLKSSVSSCSDANYDPCDVDINWTQIKSYKQLTDGVVPIQGSGTFFGSTLNLGSGNNPRVTALLPASNSRLEITFSSVAGVIGASETQMFFSLYLEVTPLNYYGNQK